MCLGPDTSILLFISVFQLMETGPNGRHGHHAVRLAEVAPLTDTGLAPTLHLAMVDQTAKDQMSNLNAVTQKTAMFVQILTFLAHLSAQEPAEISEARPSVS